jgi:hemerythrin-like metal-binding protein
MAFIDWDSSYSVGSLVLDQQHKTLVELINQLHTAMLRGAQRRDLERIFGDLVHYTDSHFRSEEGLMWQAGYPELEAHRKLHQAFIERAQQLHTQLREGKFTVSMELLRFLKTWLSEHILGTDQQYAPYLSSARRPALTWVG